MWKQVVYILHTVCIAINNAFKDVN